MRFAVLACCVVAGAIGVQGCAHPRHLAAFGTTPAGGSPLRLVVWNQVNTPIDLEVTVGGAQLFNDRAGVSNVYPKIVVQSEVYVKPGTYRVVVRDRTRGLERSLVLSLRAVANIKVMLNPGVLLLDSDEDLHPGYQ